MVRDRILEFGIITVVLLLVLSQPAAVVSVSAAGNGEFAVDVELPDGTTATEVNALLIYQAGQSQPYAKVEDYDGVDLEHVFSELPTGHDYRVTAYIQDQFAGQTDWVTISSDKFYTPGDESSKSATITVERRVPISVQAFHDDGSTPLEDATMTVESHESVEWRSGTTGEDGYAQTSSGSQEFYLYPTGDAGSYTVKISYEGDTVASRTVSSLDSSRDLELTTSEPLPTYSLSVSSTSGGDVEAEQTNGIEEGETVDVEANANPGYVFDHWEGDVPSGEREDDDISVTMTEDKELEAHFIEKTDVTFTVSKESTIPGYGFSGDPIEDAEITVDGVTRSTDDDGDVQFTLAPGEHEYTARAEDFETKIGTVDVPESGGLAVSVGLPRSGAGGLTVDVVDREGNDVARNKYRVLADGESLQLNAEGEAILDAGTYEITVEPTDFGSDELTTVSKMVSIEEGDGSSVTLTPFETPTYSLKIITPENGAVSVTPPGKELSDSFSREYKKDTKITVLAEPNVGYIFDRWKGDVSNSMRDKNSITISISQDTEITPQFRQRDLFTDDPTVAFAANTKAESGLTMGYNETSISGLKQEPYVLSREINLAEETSNAHGDPLFLLQSHVQAGGLVVTSGEAASYRTSGALYDSNFRTRRSGEHKITVSPDFRVHSGVTVTDLASLGGGGGATGLSYKLRIIDTRSGEIVASKSENVVGSKYPEEFDPSNDGRWGAVFEDGIITGIVYKIGSRAGVPEPLGTLLFEFYDEHIRDKTDHEVNDFDRPISITANLEPNREYRMEFLLIGDARSATEERGYAFKSRAILSVYGDVSGASVKKASESPPPVDNEPPTSQITGGPTGVIDTSSVRYTWEGVDPQSINNRLEYSYRLRGLDGSWSAWTPDRSVTFSDLPEGKYTFEVRARDKNGNIEQTPTSVRFTIGSVPPADINIDERQVDPGDTVRLSAKKSQDSDSIKYTYDWRQLSGPADVSDELSSGSTVDITLPDSGRYFFRLIISDGQIKNETTTAVQVGDAAPNILDYGVSTSSPTVGASLSFVAEATDSDGTIQSYEWDFDGDGTVDSTTQTAQTTHTYADPGEYTAELTVADADGNTDTASVQVTVNQKDARVLSDYSAQNGVTVDDGHAYVISNGEILKIDLATNETVTRFAIPGGNPTDLAYGDGSLWFADTGAGSFDGGIAELDPQTGEVRNRYSFGWDPTGLAFAEGSLWVVDVTSNRVIEYSPDLNQRSSFNVRETTKGRSLAYANGSLWLGDRGRRVALYEYSTDGTLLQQTGERDTGYIGLGGTETALYGPDENGDLAVLRQFEDSESDDGGPTAERRDFTGDGTEDIRISNGEVYLQLAGENVAQGRQVADVVGRNGDRQVLDKLDTMPKNPYSSFESDSPSYESTVAFEVVEENDQLASYRVVRNYRYQHTGARVQIAWQATVFADSQYALTELSIKNIGDDPVELDQDDGDIHDGIQLFNYMKLAGRDGNDGSYRFQIGDQQPRQFNQYGRWRTFGGTESGTLFDSDDAATVRLLSGTTGSHQWITESGGAIGYHVDETVVAPGDTASWTSAVAVHEGGDDAPAAGDELVDSADERVDEIPSGPPSDDPQNPTPPSGSSGSASGDPHLTTFDGVSYDFQAVGEYVLARDPTGSFEVQARLRPVGDRQVSVISAVATQLDDRNVTIDARDPDPLTVDGTAQSVSDGESLSVGSGMIFRDGNTYTIVYPGEDGQVDDGDEQLKVKLRSQRVDTTLKLAETRSGDVEGLLGSPDGNAENDIALADGTTLQTPVPFEKLYGPYRADYRVTEETSLFDYEEGESPEEFFDPDYPSERITVEDLSEETRSSAEAQAIAAGLEPGTPEFKDAVLDYGLTNDESYIDSAKEAANETNATIDATPDRQNSPPEADAGPDETVAEGAELSLDAEDSSDIDADVLTYNWTQRAGPSVLLVDNDTATPRFTATDVDQNTTLTFAVTATDGDYTDTDIVNVTVVPTNDPPVAEAGFDRMVNATEQIELHGSDSSDPDGDALSYEWTRVSGPSLGLAQADTATPILTATDVNATVSTVFRLRVSDGERSSSDTMTITVEPASDITPNISASFSNEIHNADAPITVNATVSDIEGDSASIKLRYGGTVRDSVRCGDSSCEVQLSVVPSEATWNETADEYESTVVVIEVDQASGPDAKTNVTTPVYTAGDVDGNGAVNIFDAVSIGRAWQSSRGQTGYSPAADLNNDGKVNIFDAVTIGRNWQDTAG